jgi:serine/threonine-protein phosphatase 2A regulatory subunit A
LPSVLRLFNDEDPDIQMNLIVSKLNDTDTIIEKDSFWSRYVMRVFKFIRENRQWRVRLKLIELIPQIAERSYRDFFKEDFMFGFCIACLHDPIYAIREAAIVNLEQLGCILGSTWIKKATRKVIQLGKSEGNGSYKYRMITLFALTKMAKTLSSNEVCCFILPNILNMTDDPVPNIRFNVARSLEALIHILLPEKHYKHQEYVQSIIRSMKSPLTKLCADSDSDVQFYSTRALDLIETVESNVNASTIGGSRQLINSSL